MLAAVSQLFDIAVLGGNPAGCAAACILAEAKLRVALVDYPGPSCESPLADWAPKEFWDLPGVPATAEKACRAAPFRAIRYHDNKLARQVETALKPTGGSLLHYAALSAAMQEGARKAGAKIVRLGRRPPIHLGEDSVLLAGEKELPARLLLIAQGTPQEAISDLSLPVRPPPRSQFAVAGLDVQLARGATPDGMDGLLNLVATRERGKVGLFFAAGGVVHLRLAWASGTSGAPAVELSAFLSDLQRAGLVPADLSLRGARAAVWRPPSGEALDLETHAAKRCLLLGTAGGFADSVTGQTLYPSVRSSAIAAKAAHAALTAGDPQDALMNYKNDWRKLLADSLRSPSTSVDMLMPLLMANRRLVGKFTRAVLYGQNI
jgi:flavin-dependent dehydrogenase